MSKNSKEQVEYWDKILDQYENSIGLPQYNRDALPEKELNQYLSMNRDELEKLVPQDCGQIAYRISQFVFHLQRTINREIARYNWADEEIKITIADDINNYKSGLRIRSFNLSKYNSIERIITFFSNIVTSEQNKYACNISRINNVHFRILYLLLVVANKNEAEEILVNIESSYSDLISKHKNHFKESYGLDFYKWAKSYMDEKEDYYSKQYNPITDEDFKVSVNNIFDFLWYENQNAYLALKDNQVVIVWTM